MSRRDDAHVGADRRAAANGGVLALLQHPQQAGLRLQRHVADLVEEQRAAGGLLEAAGGAHGGAGEGALLVAERSEEHTSELQSLMRISYAVFCLKKKKQPTHYMNLTRP